MCPKVKIFLANQHHKNSFIAEQLHKYALAYHRLDPMITLDQHSLFYNHDENQTKMTLYECW